QGAPGRRRFARARAPRQYRARHAGRGNEPPDASRVLASVPLGGSTTKELPMTYRFHPTTLREYDIRGIVGETLGEDDAFAIGRGFGTLVRRAGGLRVAVGYDGRESSPKLEKALIRGL